MKGSRFGRVAGCGDDMHSPTFQVEGLVKNLNLNEKQKGIYIK
jgi:hypothetical protein